MRLAWFILSYIVGYMIYRHSFIFFVSIAFLAMSKAFSCSPKDCDTL